MAELGSGCYLTFNETSNGTLFTVWSEKPVPDALGYFKPGKPVPKFKFTTQGGRSELIRTMNGPNIKRYYQGWTQFVKMAKELEGELVILQGEKFTMPTALYTVTGKDNNVSRVKENEFIVAKDVRAVAAVHSSNQSFGGGEGVLKMDVALFRETADAAGASIQF
eukprot:TRINITY_DN9497_c0_g1_i1.p1 TRINITY_DN9497_c0_g1~~TRINITY_DN9497_c0_g1_i1.p1  ORF type:complete len:165 (+),score=32.23 TRINITY_DN9497_c0_g1_i1:17-511(+)